MRSCLQMHSSQQFLGILATILFFVPYAMFRVFLSLTLVFFGLFCWAADPEAIQQQIDAARQDIAELQKLQQKLQQEQDQIQKQLRATELDIGNIERQADQLEKEVKKNEAELHKLHNQQGLLEQRRQDQQMLMAAQSRLAYINGQKEYVQLLLNQQSPEHFSRVLKYYEYLGRARVEQLAAFKDTLQQLQAVEQKVKVHQQVLAKDGLALDQQQAKLKSLKDERKATLARMNLEYKKRHRTLKARQQEQQRLEQMRVDVLAAIAREVAAEEARKKAQALAAAASSFAGQKGQLPWPVMGSLKAHYGQPREPGGRILWDGVLISAPNGSPVRAIHAGRVVFADWLQGAGLLLILDHGDGYLSLYGHNQSLLHAAGDVVAVGEPIATVGNTGGQEATALYFAIRHQGRSRDPEQWCRAQG